MTDDVLAARLRAAREQAGLSQGQVAKLMSLHRPTISEIEAGRRRVVSEELTKFADIYKVTVAWLMGEEGGGADVRVELAARELSKLKEEDLNRVLDLLQSLKSKARRP